jgi:integrase
MARPVAFENYPNVSTYTDRTGATRYRFRFKGVNKTLSGEFGSAEFQTSYEDALRLAGLGGITAKKQEMALPPDCFRKCWNDFKVSRDFMEKISDYSASKMLPMLERFLTHPIEDDVPEVTFDMVPVSEITFEQIENYLWKVATTKGKVRGVVQGGPSAANNALQQLKKLFKYAVKRKRWIKPEQNPIPYVDKIITENRNANRAWTAEERAQFEAYYALGTTQRTIYALALYMGNRRSDVATLTWDDLYEIPVKNADGSIRYEEAFIFRQEKNSKKKGGEGGKEVTLIILPQLAEALAHIERVPGRPVLMVSESYRNRSPGDGYDIASLTSSFWRWKKAAGLPAECTLHGLRSTYATMLEEAGVSDKGQTSVMGHSDIKTTKHYRRSAKVHHASIEAAEKLRDYKPEEHAIRPAAHLRVLAGGKR